MAQRLASTDHHDHDSVRIVAVVKATTNSTNHEKTPLMTPNVNNKTVKTREDMALSSNGQNKEREESSHLEKKKVREDREVVAIDQHGDLLSEEDATTVTSDPHPSHGNDSMKTRGNSKKESAAVAGAADEVSFDKATESVAAAAAAPSHTQEDTAQAAPKQIIKKTFQATYLGKPIELPLVTPTVQPQEHPSELTLSPTPASGPPPADNKGKRSSSSSSSPKRRGVPHVYHDYSKVPDMSDYNRKKTGGVTQPFPEKLMDMLTKETNMQHVVGWLPHGRAFLVRKPKAFTEDIMPKYFRQSKITSFQRQLNLYGFRRITHGPDTGAYYHEMFLRGRPQLCVQMQRQKVKGTGHKQPADVQSEPDFYSMEHMPSAPSSPIMEPESPGIHGLHIAAHALKGLAAGGLGMSALQGSSSIGAGATGTESSQQLHTNWGGGGGGGAAAAAAGSTSLATTHAGTNSTTTSGTQPAAFFWPATSKTVSASHESSSAASTNIWADAKRHTSIGTASALFSAAASVAAAQEASRAAPTNNVWAQQKTGDPDYSSGSDESKGEQGESSKPEAV